MQEKESINGLFGANWKFPSLRITVRHLSASLVMSNSHPSDGIFSRHLTAIKDSYIPVCVPLDSSTQTELGAIWFNIKSLCLPDFVEKLHFSACFQHIWTQKLMIHRSHNVQRSSRDIARALNKFWLVESWFLDTRSSRSTYIAQWNYFWSIRIQDTGCLLASDWSKIAPLCDVSAATGPCIQKSTFNQSEIV